MPGIPGKPVVLGKPTVLGMTVVGRWPARGDKGPVPEPR